jgi:hypothetical protein
MSENDSAQPAATPPFGSSQRIRNRAVWAVAFFAAAVPQALIEVLPV